MHVRGIRGVQQIALLGGEQKEQAIHEPEKLFEVAVGRERSVFNGFSQVCVGGMLQESVAQLPQGVGDAVAEILADALACLVRLGPPSLDDATRRLAVGRLEAAGVRG